MTALCSHVEAHRVHAESLRAQVKEADRLADQGDAEVTILTHRQHAGLLDFLAAAHDATADELERRVRDRI